MSDGFDLEQLKLEIGRMQVGPDSRTILQSKRFVTVLRARVLLVLLAREDEELHAAAVQAVHYCKKQKTCSVNRMLRSIAGEKRWRQAEKCCILLLQSKKRSREGPPSSKKGESS